MTTVADQSHATSPTNAPAPFRLEVKGRHGWAGRPSKGWVPALAGSLNQTRDDDATASTFESIREALSVLDAVVMPERPAGVRLLGSDGRTVFEAMLSAGDLEAVSL